MYATHNLVLFGLRTKQQHDESVPNADALEMFKEYFGALTPDSSEQDALKTEIDTEKGQNGEIRRELEQVQQEIEALREKVEKAKEEKRARE